MTVTAVIPVHNHARWVLGAVRSVARQAVRPLRVVVVDDGSSDGSADAVLAALTEVRRAEGAVPSAARGRLRGSDVEVMLCGLPEARGPSFARNWGIRAAWDDTEFFALLDSDDFYLPGKIESALAALRDPHVGAVYSDYDTLRPDGLRLRQYKEPFSRGRLLQECVVNCDSVVRRAALESVGLFDEGLRVCEDYDLWLRLSEKYLIHHVPESQVVIRVGPHSSTAQVRGPVWQDCHRRVFEKLRGRLGHAA